MRRTLAFLSLVLGGGIALGVACDNSTPTNNTTPDMAMMVVPPDMTLLPPNATSLSVDKGTTAGGTVVTITGTNFKAGATVTFGGKMATNVMVSADGLTITATTPANLGMPGAVDVVVNNGNGTASATLARAFLYFLGTVSFMAPGNTPTVMGVGANGPRNLAMLDLTGQGNISLVTGTGAGNSVAVLANASVPPALTFTLGATIPVNQNGASGIATGDMNGDGVTDVVVVNPASNTLSSIIRSGIMATPNTIATAVGTFSSPRLVAVADFDGDKNQDLVVSNANSTVSIIRGSANGTTFTSAMSSPFNIGIDAYGVAVADFDGDMRPDVAIGNQSANQIAIRIILNKAAGFAIQAQTNITGANAPAAVCAADFDGDKKIDLAFASRGNNTVAILKGDGAGAFTVLGSALTVGTSPESIVAADLNLDGFVDLVVPNLGSNNLHFITGKGDGTFNMPTMVTLAAGSSPTGVAVADFNRDGKPDIAVTRYATGGVDILLGTGM